MTGRPEQSTASTARSPDGHANRNPGTAVFVTERPWGSFQQFVSNQRVTVRIITLHPGHQFPPQPPEQRGRLWQSLDAPIDVRVGQRRWIAQPGETIWVPGNTTHSAGTSCAATGRLLEVTFGHLEQNDGQQPTTIDQRRTRVPHP